jgi:hypothetical protein
MNILVVTLKLFGKLLRCFCPRLSRLLPEYSQKTDRHKRWKTVYDTAFFGWLTLVFAMLYIDMLWQ